jgi:hypothetical protein
MMPAVVEPTNPNEWLQHLYTDCEGWLTLFSVDRTTGQQHVDWATIDQADQLAQLAQQRTATCCVWFGVATRKQNLGGRRGGGDDCLHIPALWADIDVEGPNHKGGHPLPTTLEAARLIIEEFPLAPSAVIRSGGGLQPWWLLAEPISVDEARQILPGWGATWAELGRRHGWHVDNVFDVARVMRLPGTTNRKTVPTPVTGKVCWDRRYNLSDFEPHLLEPPPAPEPGRIPYIGPERPGDAFNAVRRGGDVLAAAGFTLVRTDRGSGEEHWTRPGKAAKDGTSATVYPDGHTTIWSDTVQAQWPAVELRRPYDPFGLWCVLFSAGDFTAAREALAAQGYGTRARADDDFSWVSLNGNAPHPPGETDSGLIPIYWPAFWKHEHEGEDWLVEPLIPRGRQVALWAIHKTGKSLITLEVAAAVATGAAVFRQAAGEPADVIYCDMEMTEDDLYDRLTDLGYGPDSVLDRLHYYLLPALPPLDTPEGAAVLFELVARHSATLVVLDTMARVVAGEENDADTYRAFYRHTGRGLKALGVSLLRLDHGGKDAERGQRGSSAKGDDVDVVWQLTPTEDGLELVRRAARMSWVPERAALRRHLDPLHHTLVDAAWPPGTAELADLLDTLDIPLNATRAAARAKLTIFNHKARNDVLGKALKYRVQMWAEPEDLI